MHPLATASRLPGANSSLGDFSFGIGSRFASNGFFYCGSPPLENLWVLHPDGTQAVCEAVGEVLFVTGGYPH